MKSDEDGLVTAESDEDGCEGEKEPLMNANGREWDLSATGRSVCGGKLRDILKTV